MDLNVLLWILGGGFAGTWGLCIFFMNRSDAAVGEMKNHVREDLKEMHASMREIRAEISELKNCVKDHHARLCVIEKKD